MEETRPYHVTVFTSPESRARRITTSQTPHTFEDAAELARKARLVARIRTVFIILLCLATAAYGLMLIVPRLNPYSQQGLPRLSVSLQQVETIPMRQKIIGYERSAFGEGWDLASGTTCDTRDVVMAGQTPAAPNCDAQGSELFDPYSQELISTDAIEVDHIFPLSAAWDHGAYQWDDATRQQFANDPLNLVATSRELNQSKSDSLPEEWLPPHSRATCWYSERVAAVAAAYRLSLSESSIQVMKKQCQLGNLLR